MSTPQIKTIPQLKAEGYVGTDASLEISLREYGFAWREDGDDYKFVYAVPGGFDWGNIRKDIDPRKEFDWVSWDSTASCYGVSIQEFLAQPLPQLVYGLFNVHGFENVFGSCYHVYFALPSEDEAEEVAPADEEPERSFEEPQTFERDVKKLLRFLPVIIKKLPHDDPDRIKLEEMVDDAWEWYQNDGPVTSGTLDTKGQP